MSHAGKIAVIVSANVSGVAPKLAAAAAEVRRFAESLRARPKR